jgi:hypothetical protein
MSLWPNDQYSHLQKRCSTFRDLLCVWPRIIQRMHRLAVCRPQITFPAKSCKIREGAKLSGIVLRKFNLATEDRSLSTCMMRNQSREIHSPEHVPKLHHSAQYPPWSSDFRSSGFSLFAKLKGELRIEVSSPEELLRGMRGILTLFRERSLSQFFGLGTSVVDLRWCQCSGSVRRR